jgi:4-aminobutyrate aminotransferase-like enzyme
VIPPLNITSEELDEGLEILEEAVAKVSSLRKSRRG